MRLNIDCVRDIMLAVEEKPYKQTYTVSKLSEYLPYTEDEIEYCCYKLYEASFLELIVVNTCSSGYAIKSINELTYSGHEFLESIRPKSVWKKTKHVLAEIGSFSLSLAEEIAKSYSIDLLQNIPK